VGTTDARQMMGTPTYITYNDDGYEENQYKRGPDMYYPQAIDRQQ
jgi:hypothetical protein